MTTKSEQIEGIGRVDFVRRKGSGRISLRVKPDGVVKVNYPYLMAQKDALSFLNSKIDWVKHQQSKFEESKIYYKIGDEINTRFHTIKIISTPSNKTNATIANGKAHILISENNDIKNNEIQDFIKKIISEVYRKEAKPFLTAQVAYLANYWNFSYNKVFIKKLKSKWGSCSENKNINLSLYLMALPDHLIDYIILHELCHTVHLNHSADFWKLMNTVTKGQAKALNLEMNKFQHVIQ